jgi:hypothetical protein
MGGQANFAIEVYDTKGSERLARRAWNTLWLFGLLGADTREFCSPLFNYCDDPETSYSLLSRNFLLIPRGIIRTFSDKEIAWARTHYDACMAVTDHERFTRAMRA